MQLLPSTITRPVGRLGAAGQNALEVARFGGLQTDEEPSPYDIAREHRVYRLRHYYPDAGKRRQAPPVLLVPPMMLAAEVYDVAPNSPLRGEGVPEPGEGRQVWYLDASGETYRPLTDAAHRRLAGQAA